MSWTKVGLPEQARIKAIYKEHRGKPKFLVDESLGPDVTSLLKRSGWNAKDVFDLGINGQSDENVFAAAQRENRMVLTHDRDFLSDRRFPPQLNPGIVVLPGGEGNRQALVRALDELLVVIGETRGLWRATKIDISLKSEWTVYTFNRYSGKIDKSRFRFPEHGGAEFWQD